MRPVGCLRGFGLAGRSTPTLAARFPLRARVDDRDRRRRPTIRVRPSGPSRLQCRRARRGRCWARNAGGRRTLEDESVIHEQSVALTMNVGQQAVVAVVQFDIALEVDGVARCEQLLHPSGRLVSVAFGLPEPAGLLGGVDADESHRRRRAADVDLDGVAVDHSQHHRIGGERGGELGRAVRIDACRRAGLCRGRVVAGAVEQADVRRDEACHDKACCDKACYDKCRRNKAPEHCRPSTTGSVRARPERWHARGGYRHGVGPRGSGSVEIDLGRPMGGSECCPGVGDSLAADFPSTSVELPAPVGRLDESQLAGHGNSVTRGWDSHRAVAIRPRRSRGRTGSGLPRGRLSQRQLPADPAGGCRGRASTGFGGWGR